jgi:hypothetical protein
LRTVCGWPAALLCTLTRDDNNEEGGECDDGERDGGGDVDVLGDVGELAVAPNSSLPLPLVGAWWRPSNSDGSLICTVMWRWL